MRGSAVRIIILIILSFPVQGEEIDIIFGHMNAHNFYDNVHDEGVRDYPFLKADDPIRIEYENQHPNEARNDDPKDWTDERIDLKISKLLEATLKFHNGKIPAFLNMVEIDSEKSAQRFAKAAGYEHYIITKSSDERGINVCNFYNETANFKYISHTIHSCQVSPVFQKNPTRDLLEVEFLMGDQKVSVFGAHFPSPRSPVEERVEAGKILVNAIVARLEKNPKQAFVITGDFNTIDIDIEKVFAPLFALGFMDVHSVAEQKGFVQKTQYTIFHKPTMRGSRFDRFFVSKNLLSIASESKSFAVNPEYYGIFGEPMVSTPFTPREGFSCSSLFQNYRRNGDQILIPRSSDHNTLNPDKAGYSDHYFIKMGLRLFQ